MLCTLKLCYHTLTWQSQWTGSLCTCVVCSCGYVHICVEARGWLQLSPPYALRQCPHCIWIWISLHFGLHRHTCNSVLTTVHVHQQVHIDTQLCTRAYNTHTVSFRFSETTRLWDGQLFHILGVTEHFNCIALVVNYFKGNAILKLKKDFYSSPIFCIKRKRL